MKTVVILAIVATIGIMFVAIGSTQAFATDFKDSTGHTPKWAKPQTEKQSLDFCPILGYSGPTSIDVKLCIEFANYYNEKINSSIAADSKKADEKKIADKKVADKKIADKKIADKKIADKKAAEIKTAGKSFDLNSETCKTIKGVWEGIRPSLSEFTLSNTMGTCRISLESQLKSDVIMNISKDVNLKIYSFTNSGTITVKDSGHILIQKEGKLINNGKITLGYNGKGEADESMFNEGTLNNFGSIVVSNTSEEGINNRGTINNSGTITINNRNSESITTGINNYFGIIKNNLNGKIMIGSSGKHYLTSGINNLRTIDNSGTITISNNGGSGIINHKYGSINNDVNSKIIINNIGGTGIQEIFGSEFTYDGIICGTSTDTLSDRKIDKCK